MKEIRSISTGLSLFATWAVLACGGRTGFALLDSENDTAGSAPAGRAVPGGSGSFAGRGPVAPRAGSGGSGGRTSAGGSAGTVALTAGAAGALGCASTTPCTIEPAACELPFALGGMPLIQLDQYPSALASGDWNGDGKKDLAVAYGDDAGGLVAFPGNGNGTFAARSNFGAGMRASALVTSDFNRDGYDDLAIVDNRSNQVSALLGQADGTLTTGSSYEIAGGPRAIVATDLNGDGKQDLAVVSDAAEYAYVLLGKGDGTFRPLPGYATRAWQWVGAGDFNGDGAIDLVTSSMRYDPNAPPAPGLFVIPSANLLLGTGDGTFSNAREQALPTNVGAVTVSDLDGDGRLDLLAANFGERSWLQPGVLWGEGDGTFVDSKLQSTAQSAQVVSGDFNSDGKSDLAEANMVASRVTVRLGAGGRALESGMHYGLGLSAQFLATADLNCDGRADLATAGNYPKNRLGPLLGNRDGSFANTVNFGFSAHGDLLLRDANHDQRLDVVVADHSLGTFTVLAGSAEGTFSVRSITSSFTPAACMDMGDVNGDGEQDLILTTEAGALDVLLGRPDGGYAPLSPPFAARVSCATTGDVDHDGRAELVTTAQSTGIVSVWHYRAGQFVRTDSASVGGAAHWLALRDVDADAHLDLVTPRGVLLGNGDGHFGSERLFPADASIAFPSFADVNEDGRLDLVAESVDSDYDMNFVDLLLGAGDGTFSVRKYSLPLVAQLKDAALADLDGDGHVDLALLRGGVLDVLLGAGDGTFACSLQYPAGVSERLVIIDSNGDGRLDIVTPGADSSAIRVFQNLAIVPGACH